ncbi:MAG: DUF4872 domain-containing protein [Chloroflexi bacterium]|nr:DUF4872 domain-containing protein [Chloroflexota bacterium]
MPTLENYSQFEGRYWDTAAIRNALDYQGVKAPHTGEAFTEAMLLGISGGIAFGYFTFHYKGYDPQVNLLTRNTFGPMETIFDRLGIARDARQSTSADKGRQNLMAALEEGYAPVASPDGSLLPYNALSYDDANWYTMPLVIFGYEPEAGEAYISDRSRVPLTVSTEDLDKARGRIKKDKHRLLLLGHPDEARLADAVRQGLEDCVRLMTEKPPKGSAKNFGLRAMAHWGDMLEKSSKGSWARDYPTGRPLLAVLISSYTFLGPAFGKTMAAERDVYADFLDEAVAVLGLPALENVALRYRNAGEAWRALLGALLPETVPFLSDVRANIDRKTDLFIEQGAAQLDEIVACNARIEAAKTASESDFPMTETEIADLRGEIRRCLKDVHDAEAEAVAALKGAIA